MKKSNLLMKIVGWGLGSEKSLDSLGAFNTQLGVMVYPIIKESDIQKIYGRILSASEDMCRHRELHYKTRYLFNGKILSVKTKGKILEKLGYEVI